MKISSFKHCQAQWFVAEHRFRSRITIYNSKITDTNVFSCKVHALFAMAAVFECVARVDSRRTEC